MTLLYFQQKYIIILIINLIIIILNSISFAQSQTRTFNLAIVQTSDKIDTNKYIVLIVVLKRSKSFSHSFMHIFRFKYFSSLKYDKNASRKDERLYRTH